MRKGLLTVSVVVALMTTSCNNPVDAGVNLALAKITDFGGIFTASDGLAIELRGSGAYVRAVGSTKYSIGTSPSVGGTVMTGMTKAGDGVYTGTIVGNDGFLSSFQNVSITPNGLTSDTDFGPMKTMTRTSSTTGGPFAGGWRRVSDTYDTDIQIGIPGEGPARIYLCTLKPSVQLVKGTVLADGKTITWDVGANPPPDYEMRNSGSDMQLFVFSTLGGTYTRGSWRKGSCGVNF